MSRNALGLEFGSAARLSKSVYGDMHLKDLGSVVRVGYCIPLSDFCLVLYMAFAAKKHYNGLINQSYSS